MSTRSRKYTGTPVVDAPTSTLPISFVLLNSPVGSIRHVPRLRLDLSAGSGNVSRRQDVFELGWLQLEGRKPVVRVLQIDLLAQNAGALQP